MSVDCRVPGAGPASHEAVEQRRRLVAHELRIERHARERGIRQLAKLRVVVRPHDGHFFGHRQARPPARVERPQPVNVVRRDESQRPGQSENPPLHPLLRCLPPASRGMDREGRPGRCRDRPDALEPQLRPSLSADPVEGEMAEASVGQVTRRHAANGQIVVQDHREPQPVLGPVVQPHRRQAGSRNARIVAPRDDPVAVPLADPVGERGTQLALLEEDRPGPVGTQPPGDPPEHAAAVLDRRFDDERHVGPGRPFRGHVKKRKTRGSKGDSIREPC
jgi:hypothetical protein